MSKKLKPKDLTELLFKNNQSEEEVVEEVEEPVVETEVSPQTLEQLQAAYPHVALSIYPVKENSGTKYVVVEIPFNPDTGDVGLIKVLTKDIREDAIDRFKREVVAHAFFGDQ